MENFTDVRAVPVFENFKQTFCGGSVTSGSGDEISLDEIEVQTWNGGSIDLRADSSLFITVLDGEMAIDNGGLKASLAVCCYGAFPGGTQISGTGNAVIVSSVNYKCMALFGGPLEIDGRLRYVDGCTNSLLLAPPVKGEPCLNFLNLPTGTHQTPHTHPTKCGLTRTLIIPLCLDMNQAGHPQKCMLGVPTGLSLRNHV